MIFINKRKKIYNIYLNCRLSKVENKNLTSIMKRLGVSSKFQALRYLINNNEIIKNKEGVQTC